MEQNVQIVSPKLNSAWWRSGQIQRSNISGRYADLGFNGPQEGGSSGAEEQLLRKTHLFLPNKLWGQIVHGCGSVFWVFSYLSHLPLFSYV